MYAVCNILVTWLQNPSLCTHVPQTFISQYTNVHTLLGRSFKSIETKTRDTIRVDNPTLQAASGPRIRLFLILRF